MGMVLLAACSGDRPANEQAAATDSGMPMPMVAPVPPVAIPDSIAPPVGGMPLVMAQVGQTSASASANLLRRDSTMEVTLSVRGQPSATLQSHVHRGRCGHDEGMAVPLTPITTGADGSGSATTTVPLKDLTGNLFVQVHGAGAAPILCVDMPG
jgi:hypothetical protein